MTGEIVNSACPEVSDVSVGRPGAESRRATFSRRAGALKAAVSWAVLAACCGGPALAQPNGAEAAAEVDEITVTARKRDETDISVPVSITALGEAQIERQGILNIYDLAQRAPTITMSNTGSGVGGTVFVRGIGSAVTTGNSIDQSVAFDFDGVPISRGNILRLGQFDLDQIQVLKGPQALFFGKNSPAGVIAFTSKDPTEDLDISAKLAYEPFANYRFGEFAISGPIFPGLKARLYVRTAKSDGEKKNLAAQALPANLIVPDAVFAPPDNKSWGYTDDFIRATVLWEPSDRLTARFKAGYDMMDADPVTALKERFYCPQGRSQNLPAAAAPRPNGFGAGALAPALANALAVDDCKANGTIYQGGINPAMLVPKETIASTDTYGGTKSRITLASAEFNYALSESLDLTSVTGFARIAESNYGAFSYGVSSPGALIFNSKIMHRQFTQEVRLTSNFDSPFNFMIGGFYQDAFFRTYTNNTAVPPHNVPEYRIPNEVLSGFGQITWDVTDQLELAAGVRYTEEDKSLTFLRDFVPQPVLRPKVTFHNTSPEATVTWRPSEDLTAYVAYKSGFKSGGYASVISGNFAPLTTPRDFSYEPEDADGFEGGLKMRLLDRTVRLDVTAYSFEYSNLQVSNVNTSTGAPVLQIFNAASAKQEGIEVEGNYNPPMIRGLRLNGMVNYNKSTYTEFDSPCYIGQSIAEGCNMALFQGRFRQQSLAGRRVTNAPLWAAAVGFNYSHPFGDDMIAEFGADASYKSSYNVTQELSPGGRQKAATYLNAQVRIINEEKGWEFGIYAKNITDEYRVTETSNAPLTGTDANTGTVNGGILSRADLSGNTNPGRTVMFQLVLRPSVWMD